MEPDRIILAGGSGFLGQALAAELTQRGRLVIVLTRHLDQRTDKIRSLHWDGRTIGPWAVELDGAAAIVNLTGKNVNCRYTPANRREIVESRVDSVNVLGEAIRRCRRPPKVFVQAASLAIYGDAGERVCDETAPPSRGFSAETCLAWESAFNALDCSTTRRVLLRIGFVLGREGGALRTLDRLTRCFLGGRAGSGRQYISWLHLHDMLQIFLFSLDNPDWNGVFNATSPDPVTNAQFMRELRHAIARPWSPPIPNWAVRIGARLMKTEAELALTGRRCLPQKLLDNGFRFAFPHLPQALANLYTSSG